MDVKQKTFEELFKKEPFNMQGLDKAAKAYLEKTPKTSREGLSGKGVLNMLNKESLSSPEIKRLSDGIHEVASSDAMASHLLQIAYGKAERSSPIRARSSARTSRERAF